MQCKSLNVWSVSFSLTHFLAKTIFPEGMGDVQNSSGDFGEVGVILVVKNGNLRRKGGLREIPSLVGVWIFSGSKQFK